jgi:4-amino-4-deoxy-L-arabinose transferase-like glycosyltransferase
LVLGKNTRGQIYILLLAIILLAFTLRVYRLGYQSLWDDEAKSVWVSSWSVTEILVEQSQHEHPPLHYLLLHGWIRLAGESEFSVRFVSLFFGLLSVPMIYKLGKALSNARLGLLAAFVAAISPFWVYFSQETRMYTTATFFSLSAVYFFARILRDHQKSTGLGQVFIPASRRLGLGLWLGYVLTTFCSLYSHYFALFAIVFENLFLASLWRRYRSLIKSWALAQIGVALLFLPWLAFMAAGVIGIETSQPERTALIGPNAPAYGLLATWLEGWRGRKSLVNVFRTCLIAFGLGESAQPNLKLPLAVVLLIILIVGTVSLARDHSSLMQRREAAAFLLLYLTVPILLGYLTAFPAERPHWSKYFILASPAYYLLVAAGLAALWKRRVGGLIAGLIFVACASGSSLFNCYFNPQYARPDFRPQIAYIETFSQADDALMVNPRGLFTTFWHYYRGDLTYYPPPEETDTANIEATLRQIAERHSGLWVVKNVPNDFDPDETIEWWLTHHTYRTMTAWVGHNVFRYYSMPVNGEPVHHPLQVNFAEQILLTDYDLAIRATKYGHILQATLWWQALTEMDEQYLVSLRVLDQSGHLGGRKAIPPLGNFRPTVGWAKGEQIEDHVGLFIWPGTPPGEYWVKVGLVNGSDGQPLVIVTNHESGSTNQESDHILLGPVTIGQAHAPPPIEELQFQHPVGVDLDGLRLLGYSLTSELIRPGDTLPFVLFWQAREKMGRDYLVSLQLQDGDGQAWGEHCSRPVEGAYPTIKWAKGEIVRDQRDWVVPSDVPSGRYHLLVSLIDEASGEQVAQANLGWLTVEARERVTTVPSIGYPLATNWNHQVELLGYDLEKTSLRPGDTLHLTLYWRALAEMDKSYTVFTHLLDSDSRILGQKDSVPGDGTLPTTSWVAGEIITDRYEIAVHSDAQPGRYVLEIGFYDADTGQRLPIVNQESQQLDDRVLLPTGITLE